MSETEQPKSCPTCGGSMHEPCPYREEAERNAGEHYRQLPDAAWPWRDVKDHPFSELLTNAYARSLRLADENAALQQRVKELEEIDRKSGEILADMNMKLSVAQSSLTHYGESGGA